MEILNTTNDGSVPAMVKLQDEIMQTHKSRSALYGKLEKKFNDRCVLLYFTSMTQQVIIDDTDADMIENVLQISDLSRGLSMIINSPGGDGLAAERIINICRSYSNDDFEVIVPKMAKSAATMIAFGANKILMSKTAELGPIDPQIISENNVISAHNLIVSYEELLKQAVDTSGNLEPYLQQLARYDAGVIKSLKASQDLADNIAVSALKTGMMKTSSEKTIKSKIKPFTDPTITSSHGRMIGMKAVANCGINVEEILLGSETWKLLWELYVRIDWCVKHRCSKIVETKNHSFATSAIQGRGNKNVKHQ